MVTTLIDTRPERDGDGVRTEIRFVEIEPTGEWMQHPGACCESCVQDEEYGFTTAPDCCCKTAHFRGQR